MNYQNQFMKVLAFLLLLIISSASFSQAKTTFYFNKDMSIVSEKDAAFTGTGETDNGLYKLTCYNKAANNLVFIAHFTDSTFNIFQGLFRSYYPGGGIENEGVYNNGKEQGLWKKRDKNGNIVDSTWYLNGKKESSTAFVYSIDGRLEMGMTNDSANNNLQVLYYDENGKVVEKDASNDDTDIVFTKVEIEAAFPGGPVAWQRYITRQIQHNIGEFTQMDYGTCLVKFIVDTSGHISSVHAMTMGGTRLARVTLKAISSGPNWVPAQVNGRKVKAFRIQPVTLTDPNR